MITKEDGFTYFDYDNGRYRYKSFINERGQDDYEFHTNHDPVKNSWYLEQTVVREDGSHNLILTGLLNTIRLAMGNNEKIELKKSSLKLSSDYGHFVGKSSYRFDIDNRLLQKLRDIGTIRAKFINEAIDEKIQREFPNV